MVDFYIEEYKKLNPNQEIPEEMTNKRQHVVEEYKKLKPNQEIPEEMTNKR